MIARDAHSFEPTASSNGQRNALEHAVGNLSRVIKVYQEMYKNSHVMPCIDI